MKLFGVETKMFRRDYYLFGKRIASSVRSDQLLEAVNRKLQWMVHYRELKQHGIELPADCHFYWTGHYEVATLRVGDIRRTDRHGTVALEDSVLVRFLRSGDRRILQEYYDELARHCGMSESAVREQIEATCRTFDRLREIEYDPSISCIVVNHRNEIVDGFHRSSALLVRHGPGHEVKVVRILPMDL